jgi:hypothetical protein
MISAISLAVRVLRLVCRDRTHAAVGLEPGMGSLCCKRNLLNYSKGRRFRSQSEQNFTSLLDQAFRLKSKQQAVIHGTLEASTVEV